MADVTPQQAKALDRRLRPLLGYLVRLTNRMQQRGWRATDPAYQAAWAARHALHELCVRLHAAMRPPPDGPAPGKGAERPDGSDSGFQI
jgi:hypothetical protein